MVFRHCASETGQKCIYRITSPVISPSLRGEAKPSGNGVWIRSGGLIFEGKAAHRKSHESQTGRRERRIAATNGWADASVTARDPSPNMMNGGRRARG